MIKLNFIIIAFVFVDNIVLDYGMTMESVDFSFTESISLDPSFTTFSMSDLPDMDSFSTSMSFTPTISFTDSFSLPDLDDSTSFIDPTSTSDFQMSSTALIDCGPPEIVNGSFSGETSQGQYNSAEFNCVDGYLVVGPGLVTCHPNGSWSELPACLIDCSNPNIPRGQYNGNTFDGSNVTVECDFGRYRRGPETIRCQSNGEWTNFPECVYDCGNLEQPSNGNVVVDCTYEGCNATYSCDEGFEIDGAASRQCVESSGWDPPSEPSCAAVDCGQPTPQISNSNFTVTSTTYQTDILVACANSYIVSGNGIITCQSNGMWSQLPECLYDCGTLSPPANGQMEGNCTTVGCESIFTCDTNFVIVGENVSTCEEGRGWTSSSPACATGASDTSSECVLVFENPPPADAEEYNQWREELESFLTNHYSTLMGSDFQDVVITSIEPNGTVTYYVVYNDNNGGESAFPNAHAALSSRTITLLNETQPIVSTTVDGETYNLAILSNPEEAACAIYEKSRNGCPGDTECAISMNRTYCKPSDVDDNGDAIIGLTAGVLAFLITAPVIVFCILMVKKQRSIRKEEMSPPSSMISEPSIFNDLHPALTAKTMPLRFNTFGRAGEGLYGSEYAEQNSNRTRSIADSDTSSEVDYEVTLGVEQPRPMMSRDNNYHRDDY